MEHFKLPLVTLFLCSLALVISTFAAAQTEQEVAKRLIERARASVINSREMEQKEDVLSLLDSLNDQGIVSEFGSDQLRIKYVHAQNAIEHNLACALVLGEIENLIGVIHTPTPATPLCTKVDPLDTQLLDPSMRNNPEKLLTVRSRTVTLREYLEQGGKLFIAYPQGGLEKRTLQQQAVYHSELVNYADRLIDAELSCSEMNPSYVGATYFFKAHDAIYAFSIKATQANNPQDYAEWGLWMGQLLDPAINQRVNDILNYLEANGGPHIRKELSIDRL